MFRPIIPIAALALWLPTPLAASELRPVISSAPDKVSVTIYRDGHGRGDMDRNRPRGFAMITETRKLRLPRGKVTLNFENVAEGIIPVSAVIEGLPGGTIEKNRDARLLSPASLIDGTLGREVTLTRTDKATGRKFSESATIIAGPQSGVILRTETGIETLRCAGLPERLAFNAVPQGLSAKPVLSVVTDNPAAQTVTVKLSYLASGFDWRASYVATQSSDATSLNLFAWLTLANGNGQHFTSANVQAVAGHLNRVASSAVRAAAADLRLICYPLGTTTSDLPSQHAPEQQIEISAMSRLPPVPPPPTYALSAVAPAPPPPPPEDLADLKLFRVAEPVTISPRSQKQVALLIRDNIAFERRYRRAVQPHQQFVAAPTAILLMMRNEKAAGLGVPLPQGTTALYTSGEQGQQLLGLGSIADRAEGEDFRLAAGFSSQVTVDQKKNGQSEALLTVSNNNPVAVVIDIPIGSPGNQIKSDSGNLRQVDGIMTWSTTIAPHENAELRYSF